MAVIDGVTSKSDFTYHGKTTGKIAAEVVKHAIGKLKRQDNLADLLSLVNQEIKKSYQEIDFPYSKKEKGLQAVCAVYSDFYREIWLIGDCQVAVDNQIYLNPKKSDTILADMRSLILHILREDKVNWLEAQKKARNFIEPWILKANVFANREEPIYGYAVINGEDIPQSLIKKIQLDENYHEIILASDGYPVIKTSLQKSEDYLNTILERDNSCCEMFLSTKGIKEGQTSFDDRTYIRFSV